MKIQEYTSQTCFYEKDTMKPNNRIRQSVVEDHMKLINFKNKYTVPKDMNFAKHIQKNKKELSKSS